MCQPRRAVADAAMVDASGKLNIIGACGVLLVPSFPSLARTVAARRKRRCLSVWRAGRSRATLGRARMCGNLGCKTWRVARIGCAGRVRRVAGGAATVREARELRRAARCARINDRCARINDRCVRISRRCVRINRRWRVSLTAGRESTTCVNEDGQRSVRISDRSVDNSGRHA